MRHPLRLILFSIIAVFTYVICDNLWGISNSWQIEQVLSMWQIAITGVGLIAATAAVYFAAVQFRENREQERQARSESLSQIRSSLKSELETNLQLLRSEQYKIWAQAPDDEQGHIAILVRPLKTSIFELVAGREDLKYLQPPDALGIIAEAYDQTKDFNSILESWLRRGVYEQEKGHYSFHGEVDLSVLTTKHLNEQKEDTIAKINKALKVL